MSNNNHQLSLLLSSMVTRREENKNEVVKKKTRRMNSSSSADDGYNFRRRMRNNATSMEPGDFEMDLVVSVHHAEGLDNPTATRRVYGVVFWVHPDIPYATRHAEGLPNPEWNRKFQMELDKERDCRFLYVEVIRFGHPSGSDPGTSTGQALVGRARIPLPKLSTKKVGRYGLVRLEGDEQRAKGHITLSMELMKIEH